MANWCSNIVIFKGGNLGEVLRLFELLIQQEKEEGAGQLPYFIDVKDGYMFELWRISNVVNYETRWSPNTDIVKQIADHFQVDFIHEYVEPMNNIHGKISYENGVLTQLK